MLAGGMGACNKKSSPAPPVTPPDTLSHPATGPSQVALWLTNADKSVLFQQQSTVLNFGTGLAVEPVITVDTTQVYQTIDGFGYALTGGSAQLIYGLPAAQRQALEQELFATDSTHIGVSYLRLTIGASDMSARVFSYDDNASPSQPDTTLAHFDLSDDKTYLVPLLKEILAVNPSIKLLGCPWSPPAWMKSNNSPAAGSLLPQYYPVYAQYFVKYIQAMKANGIPIDAVTPQNEPLNANNNPSNVMQDTAEDVFVRDYLGPAFQSAGITTKIIVWDHNCDVPSYPEYIFGDAAAAQYVDGSAWHLYGGNISALSTVHDAFPNKNVYFTEQYVARAGKFSRGSGLGHHQPDRRRIAKLEPECVGVEYGGRCQLWSSYCRRLRRLPGGLYDPGFDCYPEYVLLYYRARLEICAARIGAGGVEY